MENKADASDPTKIVSVKEISTIDFKIYDAELAYEYFTPLSGTIKEPKITFPLDLYQSQFHTVTGGSSSYRCEFFLKKNTVLAYISLIRDFQYDLNPHQKKSLSTFTRFPSDLYRLTFYLNGRKYAFEDGLKYLNKSDQWRSKHQRLYYNYIESRGLIDDAFTDFFEDSAGEASLQQTILLDFSTIQINERDSLVVDVEFTGALDKNSYKVLCVTTFPGQVERTGEKNRDGLREWKLTVI